MLEVDDTLQGSIGIFPRDGSAMPAKPVAIFVQMSHIVMEKAKKLSLVVLFILIATEAQALMPVEILKTKNQGPQPADSEIAKTVHAHIHTRKYREIKVQLIRDSQEKPSHYLVYLLSKTSHRVDFVKIAIDQHFKVLSVQQNYKLQDIDLKQQPGLVPKNTTFQDKSH
jgi:hypothetical protein